MIIPYEIDRALYAFAPGSHEDKLLLVQEQQADDTRWRPLVKGWAYQLWIEIGKRGGLCEARELQMLKAGRPAFVPIEDYVALYRQFMTHEEQPIEAIFDRFAVRIDAWRKKAPRQQWTPDFEATYHLAATREDADTVYYQHAITSVEQLTALPVMRSDEDYAIQLVFTPVPSMAPLFSPTA